MEKSFMPESLSHPNYDEIPLLPTQEEAVQEQYTHRNLTRKEAEEAFRTTLETNRKAGVVMPSEFRVRYEQILGKRRVVELIKKSEEPDLFGQD